MTSTLLRTKYRSLVCVLTLVFALLSLVAPAFHFHHHPVIANSQVSVKAHGNVSQPIIAPIAATVEDNCVLCSWLSGACYTFAKPFVAFLIALSAAASLLIFVRCIALCNAPQPLRIPRAPPILRTL